MSDAVIITRQSKANGVAVAWREQYANWTLGEDKAKILAGLLALGPSPDPDEVDRCIGNTSWTDTGTCHGCSRHNPPFMIRVGETPDYESGTADLCSECLGKAVEAVMRHIA